MSKNALFPCVVLILVTACSELATGGVVVGGNNVEATMSVGNLRALIEVNQSHVPANSLEYAWCVNIDSDNDAETGDDEGYDVAMCVTHFKPSASVPATVEMLAGTQHNTWILTEASTFGHGIDVIVDLDADTITMVGSREFVELTSVGAGDRYQLSASYYAPGGLVTDSTDSGTIGSPISDAANEVPHLFIDIRGGMIDPGLPVRVNRESWGVAKARYVSSHER